MIVLFVVTRNEAALLRLNLRHHLGWSFDHVAIADNESSDATQDVLRDFGDVVTSTRIGNPYERYAALSRLFTTIEERHGAVDWVAVSDTDEFWWTSEGRLADLLRRVPADLVAVNSDQKLFLPTQSDSMNGPIYCRRTFRTSGANSPLHTSYALGKTLYRAAWLRSHEVLSAHWSRDLPHALWRYERPLVHHYMIGNEDDFVKKVKGFERWAAHDLRDPTADTALYLARTRRGFKAAWWRLYEQSGEAGLRDYYRREYVISASDLPIYLQRGVIVEDAEFANFKRSDLESGLGPLGKHLDG